MLKLNAGNQKIYDDIVARMQKELEEELLKCPPRQKNQLDGARSEVYRKVTAKYLPELRAIPSGESDEIGCINDSAYDKS